MAVYQTFINSMNEKIRRQIAVNNPFVFKHISNLKVASFALVDNVFSSVFLDPDSLSPDSDSDPDPAF
jgi:hypothetical protein